MKIVIVIAAATFSLAAHAQPRSPDTDPAVKTAFGFYASCVMSNATLMVGNEQESAVTIAEVAEVRCTDKRASVIAAVEHVLGPAPKPEAREKLMAELKVNVIKRVAGELLAARQRVARERAGVAPIERNAVGQQPFRVVCTVTRGDGAAWGAPMRVTVNPLLRLVDDEPAQIGARLITWERPPLFAGSIVALSLDRETGGIFAHFKGTATIFFQGSCEPDKTYGVQKF